MSAASQICASRIVASNSEGFRADVYDDATSQPIACKGQPTIGYGCRCRGWSKALALNVLQLQVAEYEDPLLLQPWYLGCNDARRSALLEIAFNQGDSGLENGYPRLIAAVRISDWVTARIECTVEDPRLKARYAVLANILYTGVLPP